MRCTLPLLLCAACAGPAPTPPPQSDAPLRFALPLWEPDRFFQVVGVDHDPTDWSGSSFADAHCQDYLGRSFPYCYDQHDGSDFLLEGGFASMDAGSTPVLAAADGVVVSVHDGEYDRCHGQITGGVSCDGNPIVGNHVIIEHEGGWQTLYWHFKQASIVVSEGQALRCGDPLGLVGSSGYSSLPHLHFEVVDPAGTAQDPFSPPERPDDSLWRAQGETNELPGPPCIPHWPTR